MHQFAFLVIINVNCNILCFDWIALNNQAIFSTWVYLFYLLIEVKSKGGLCCSQFNIENDTNDQAEIERTAKCLEQCTANF